MKIRLGFVSNSSSTSYVIAVTRNFQVTKEKAQLFLDECTKDSYYASNDVKDIESAIKKIKEVLEAFCTHEEIWEEEAPIDSIYEFITVFREEVVLIEMESGPEDGRVMNILADKCGNKNFKRIKKLMEQTNEN